MLRKNDSPSPVELRDVAPGLLIWRVQHPRWRPGQDWGTSCTVDLRGVRGQETRSGSACSSLRAVEAWNRLDARTPTAVVILKPHHVRDVDLFVSLSQVRAFGPRLFLHDDMPATELKPVRPGLPAAWEGWSPSTTDGGATKHRYDCPSRAPTFSPTH